MNLRVSLKVTPFSNNRRVTLLSLSPKAGSNYHESRSELFTFNHVTSARNHSVGAVYGQSRALTFTLLYSVIGFVSSSVFVYIKLVECDGVVRKDVAFAL